LVNTHEDQYDVEDRPRSTSAADQDTIPLQTEAIRCSAQGAMSICKSKPDTRRSRGDRIISRSEISFRELGIVLKEIHKWVVISNEFE